MCLVATHIGVDRARACDQSGLLSDVDNNDNNSNTNNIIVNNDNDDDNNNTFPVRRLGVHLGSSG
jgi:hypothetical protein